MKKSVTGGDSRVCARCEFSREAFSDGDGELLLLCSKKGAVRDMYVCNKFKYDPLKREPRKRVEAPGFEYVDINE